eukprot:4556494-Pyramimonas_sp.AAC.1
MQVVCIIAPLVAPSGDEISNGLRMVAPSVAPRATETCNDLLTGAISLSQNKSMVQSIQSASQQLQAITCTQRSYL